MTRELSWRVSHTIRVVADLCGTTPAIGALILFALAFVSGVLSCYACTYHSRNPDNGQ